MSFFDFNKIYVKDSQGRKVLYPLGFFGRGFIVETKQQEEQIRGLYKKSFVINITWFVLLIISYWVPNIPTILFLLLIFGYPLLMILWFHFASKKITKHLAKSLERPTFLGWIRIFAKRSPWAPLIIMEGMLVYALIGLIKVLITERYLLMGEIISLLFFSFTLFLVVILGYMIFYKVRNK